MSTITEPGKFEGEASWVPEAWDRCLEGFSLYDTGHFYVIDHGDSFYILHERGDGFVDSHYAGDNEENAIDTAQVWEEEDYGEDSDSE